MRTTTVIIALLALAPAVLAVAAAPAQAAGTHAHIAIIVEENRNLNQVIGDPNMPYLNGLAKAYSSSTQWRNILHPSEPNYIALAAGSNLGVVDDNYHAFGSTANLGAQLTAAGVSWKAYMENIPSVGFQGDSYPYARKHDPFIMFSGNDAHVVPATQYWSDLQAGTLPEFIFYVPNLLNDGHDAANGVVDASLKSIVPPLMASSWYTAAPGGTIVVTYDEDAGQGVFPHVIVSENARSHANPAGNHYATLRTVEDAYGLARLGGAAGASSFASLLGAPAAAPAPAPTPAPTPTPTPTASTLTISSAVDAAGFAQGGTVSGSVTVTASATTTVNRIVLAARPPGGTVNGGPYLDVGGQGPVALAAGVPTTLRFSRALTPSDPVGSWFAFGAVQLASGAWQNEPATHAFSVVAAGTSTPAPTPVPTPAPTPSGMAATFSPYGGNNWWVQTNVVSSSTVASVCASVNGAACQPLVHQSWGAWAASFYVPTGATVVFTTKDASGASATSGGYLWPAATPVAGAPSVVSTFSATFTPYGGNNWWVQTNVASSSGIASVCASVAGGACQPLTHESWGAWAASFYVATGSPVVFRATSSAGATATSGAYSWPVP